MKLADSGRRVIGVVLILGAAIASGGASLLLGVCGPFTDVSDAAFCPFVLEIFYLGITTGTTPTTYDPAASVSRLQMAAFLSRSADGVLRRGSRRAALNQYWTPQNSANMAFTILGGNPKQLRSDGADIWVANSLGTIARVRGSDGKLLDTWTGADGIRAVLVAMGRVLGAGAGNPGKLYGIDPSLAPGTVVTVAPNLGADPAGITSDGSRIWTANAASVSRVTPGTLPWTVTTVTTGFVNPVDALFDGGNVWVVDDVGTLLRLDANAAVLQTVTVGSHPRLSVFDGGSIWVPNNNSNSVSVVRASTGAVLATLTGNGMALPTAAAFDGQRVMIVSETDVVSLFKAADLTALGFFVTGSGGAPHGACSDGVNFWIALSQSGQIVRF